MPRNEHFAYNLVEHDCGTVTTLKHSKISKFTLDCSMADAFFFDLC